QVPDVPRVGPPQIPVVEPVIVVLAAAMDERRCPPGSYPGFQDPPQVVQVHLKVVDGAFLPPARPEQRAEFVRADLAAGVEQKPFEQMYGSFAPVLVSDQLIVDRDSKRPEE